MNATFSSKKRRIDQLNDDTDADAPLLKKRKIKLESFMPLIPRLEQKQMQIRQRFSSFCDGIIEVMHTELNQNPNYKINVTNPILFEILSYSNHSQVQQFWMSMEQRLKTFSFMIKPPHTLQEIIEFETKYRQKTKDTTYHIPDALRISLLLARSIEMPPIFKHLKKSNFDSFLSLFESFILPLDQWKFVHAKGLRHYRLLEYLIQDACKFAPELIDENIKWFKPDSDEFFQTLCIGHFANQYLSAEIFMNGAEIMFACEIDDNLQSRKFDLSGVDWTEQTKDDEWYRYEEIERHFYANIHVEELSQLKSRVVDRISDRRSKYEKETHRRKFKDEERGNNFCSELMRLIMQHAYEKFCIDKM